MRSFLIAAAAIAALALPAEPADARRGGHHWQSGHHQVRHWQGHRGWNRHVVRHHRPWRHFRGHRRFVHHGFWPRHHWGWRSHQPSVVFVSFGNGGWGHGCRNMWHDGWGWRCVW